MARTILLPALLVALLAPGAAALDAALDPLAPVDPDLLAAVDTSTLAVPELPQAASLDDLRSRASGLAQPVEELLACDQAVRVTLEWYGARVRDTRRLDAEFLAPYGWTETLQQQVPVYRTVTETLWQPGLLGGLVQPVTRTFEELVGHDLRTFERGHTVDLAVHAQWREDYLDWSTHRDSFLVSLPVGLPLVATGEGVLEQACGGEVLTYLPDPDTSGADVICAACLSQPEDGWAVHVLSVRATLADADDYATLERDEEAPADLLEAVQEKGALLGLSALDDEAQDQERRKVGLDATAPAAPEAPAPAASSAVVVPMGTGLLLLIIVVVVVTLFWVAAIAVVARRKKE